MTILTLRTKSRFGTYYQQHPLTVILVAAFILRLLAAFFSKGYAFHDDHFCVIRVANSWANGIPHWLQAVHPPKHSMIYAGINAAFMWLMERTGVADPEVKTTILRVFHAGYSLLIVYFGYKITLLLSNKRNAILAGWILALLWFMPYLSVKFLAELVCVPPVLAAFYYILKAEKFNMNSWWPWVLAGTLFGFAFTIRLHTILFAGGIGMVLLIQKKWQESVCFTIAYLVIILLLIGIPDMIFFDYPFQYVVNYFLFNSENAYNYITGSPFKFLLTTFGFLVPPVSIFLMWGYIKTWKIEPKMFLAVLIFFLVHSFFPNKQERFLLPMYPLLIILGVIGWNKFKDASGFWTKHPAVYSGLWKFFWTINIIAAVALALTFTKKDRIAPLSYLSTKSDVQSIIIETERGKVKQPPVYYLGGNSVDYNEFLSDELGLKQIKANRSYLNDDYMMVFTLGADKTIEELKAEMNAVQKSPNYVVFSGDKNLEARKRRILALFPKKELVFLKEISPSMFDQLLNFLNPRVHRNDVAQVYKLN